MSRAIGAESKAVLLILQGKRGPLHRQGYGRASGKMWRPIFLSDLSLRKMEVPLWYFPRGGEQRSVENREVLKNKYRSPNTPSACGGDRTSGVYLSAPSPASAPASPGTSAATSVAGAASVGISSSLYSSNAVTDAIVSSGLVIKVALFGKMTSLARM